MNWPVKGAARRLESDPKMGSVVVNISRANFFPAIIENPYVSWGEESRKTSSQPL